MVGRTISHYRIVGQLGSGGMGTVYRAEDVRLGREVALKFVADDLAHERQAGQRLHSEARAASALNHGSICTIYDIDEHDGHPFIVMELMKGRTLRDRLEAGPLKVHQIVDMGIEIADALHAAHSAGIVHRDIKPANIFLTDQGHVKILDFGLAKLTPLYSGSATTRGAHDPTAAGVTLGTISYMSPEQATGEDLDGRTDLFSLGVVLYECATGRHPFQGKTSAVVLANILNRAPMSPGAVNPELPGRLQDVIVNCLEKDRELRYQSAAEVRADLKRVRRDIDSGHSRAVDAVSGEGSAGARLPTPGTGSPVAPRSAASALPSGPVPARFRTLLVGAAVAAIVGLGILSYALWRRSPLPVPHGNQLAATSNEAAQRVLARARASMEARDYRGALTHASEALAIDADNPGAAKVRDEARAMLAQSEAAVVEARERLAAGDLEGAARALDRALAIDPGAPSVAEMSSRLAELRRREGGGQDARPARSVAERSATRNEGPPAREPARAGPPPARPSPPAATRSAESVPRQVSPAADATPASPGAPTTTPAQPPPAPAAAAETRPPPPVPATPPSKPAETAPAAAPPKDSQPAPAAASPPETDEAAIRRVVALYARAIEAKDLALFRSIKPNLTREEERRLEEGFRAVKSQRVSLTILSIDVRDRDARVVLRRRDTIEAGGRQQTSDSQQTLTLNKTTGGWAVVEIR